MNKPVHFPPWLLALLAALFLAAPAFAQKPALTFAAAASTAASAPKAAPSRPASKPALKPALKPTPKAAPAATSAAVSATAAAPEQSADYIVAVVNSEPITNHEVRARAARIKSDMARQNVPVPSDAQLRRDVLERLITERAQLQQARDEGLTVDDDMLRQAELSIARQNQLSSVEELERRVQADEGIPVQDFRDDVRRQVLIARLRERNIEPTVKVSDAEVDAFLRSQMGQNPNAAATAVPQLNMAMILIAVPENASLQDLARLSARADDVARRAKAGEDFAALARQYSDANGRGQDGGVLGLRPANRFPPLFVQALGRAKVGDVAGPVRSAAGFHILKLLNRRQPRDLPDVTVPQTRVSQILLRTGPSQSEQVARDRLADFKRRIASGQTTFEALARQYSQDESASAGGDMGWIATGQLPRDLAQILDSLNVGQISNPIVTPRGVTLLRADERRQQVLTAAQQRQLARSALRDRKTQEAFDTWAREVRGRAWVEYRDPPQ